MVNGWLVAARNGSGRQLPASPLGALALLELSA